MDILKLLRIILAIVLLSSNQLTKANDWGVQFETNNVDLRMTEKKSFNLTIYNLRISQYHDSVHVVSSDPRIVQVSNTGFVYDFVNGSWKGSFSAIAVGVGNANVSVEVIRDTNTETSSETMEIKVHRNRIVALSSWFFYYFSLSVSIAFYITIGMVLDWRKCYAVIQRPAGLFDSMCILVILVIMVSKNSYSID